jgi:hypothetical protein
VNQSSLIGKSAIRSDENVIGHGLAKHLDAKHVCKNLLRLAIEVRMNESHVIIAGHDVAQSRESLFHATNSNRVRERVANLDTAIAHKTEYTA